MLTLNKNRNKFNFSFNSELNTVKTALKDINGFLSKSFPYISPDLETELKLIFSELLCNAVIHGNKCDKSKSVNVYIEIIGNNIYSIIKDEGIGFDYYGLLNKFEDGKSSMFSESGRGIWLVYSLSDSLAFNIKGNEIKFLKKVVN